MFLYIIYRFFIYTQIDVENSNSVCYNVFVNFSYILTEDVEFLQHMY